MKRSVWWLVLLILIACSSDTDALRPLDQQVSNFVTELDVHGISTERSKVSATGEACLGRYQSDLHVFHAPPFERIDFYSFSDESLAIAASDEIPADADCHDDGVVIDWSEEFPYFRCGALIAFIQSPDDGLQSAFEELCGPPFAVTVARFPAVR